MTPMGEPAHPTIALFALTGFGNAVLPALCAAGLPPAFVVTRLEPAPYPHYPEEPLPDLASRLGVPCLADEDGEQRLDRTPTDLLLVATYHRVLKSSLLAKVGWAVNLHPSLLPVGRGPNPFYWAIRNAEAVTGITAHLMTGKPDAGPMLWSEKISIPETETQGSLRRRLASVAARGAVAVVKALASGTAQVEPQDEAKATGFLRPHSDERVIRPEWMVGETARRVRAWSPSPGMIAGDRTVIGLAGVAEASPVPPGTIVSTEAGLCRMRLADGDIVLILATDPLTAEPAP